MLFPSVLILSLLWLTVWGLRPWRTVALAAKAAAVNHDSQPSETTAGAATLRVSVVSCVTCCEDELPEYVAMLLSQDYPDLEIVLVCDATAEATAMLAERFGDVPNLRITFIPPGSHHLSRRKLAQTVGVKGASGDIVLLTSTSVRPVSSRWVSEMAAPFAADSSVGMSMGYVRPVPSDFRGQGKWYRQFDALTGTVSWMYAAQCGIPYRADGFNLAFRRSLFFDNKGYASTISLMEGDDDIFVHEMSGRCRTALQLVPESFVDTRWGDSTDSRLLEAKESHAFTRRFLPAVHSRLAGTVSFAQWTVLLSALAAVAVSLPWLIPGLEGCRIHNPGGIGWLFPRDTTEAWISGSMAVMLPFWCWAKEISAYRSLAASLRGVRLFWSVPLFILWRPIGNALFSLNHRHTRKTHFTWCR